MSYVKLRALPLRIGGAASREEGQTLFEFTLIVSLVALVAVVVLSMLGVIVAGFFAPLPGAFGG
jgi:Flp pilus assembly pilin Flp